MALQSYGDYLIAQGFYQDPDTGSWKRYDPSSGDIEHLDAQDTGSPLYQQWSAAQNTALQTGGQPNAIQTDPFNMQSIQFQGPDGQWYFNNQNTFGNSGETHVADGFTQADYGADAGLGLAGNSIASQERWAAEHQQDGIMEMIANNMPIILASIVGGVGAAGALGGAGGVGAAGLEVGAAGAGTAAGTSAAAMSPELATWFAAAGYSPAEIAALQSGIAGLGAGAGAAQASIFGPSAAEGGAAPLSTAGYENLSGQIATQGGTGGLSPEIAQWMANAGYSPAEISAMGSQFGASGGLLYPGATAGLDAITTGQAVQPWTTNPSLESLGGVTSATTGLPSLGNLPPTPSIPSGGDGLDPITTGQEVQPWTTNPSLADLGGATTGGAALTGLGGLLQSLGLPANIASALGPLLPSLLGAGLGAAAGGSPSTQTQSTDIPEWLKPYYTKTLDAGITNLNNSQNLSAGENSTIANLVASLQQPNAGLNAANQTLTDTAAGKYLDISTNPQWQDLSTQIGEKYNMFTRPATDAQFSRAGAFGVGNSAWAEFTGQNQADLARGLATGAANIYGNERNLQNQAATNMPTWQTQFLTQLPNAALTAQGYGRNVAQQGLSSMAGILGATRGPQTSSSSSQNSMLNNILGGALTGGALGRLWG